MILPFNVKVGLKSKLTVLIAVPHILAVVVVMLAMVDVHISHVLLLFLFALVLLSSVISIFITKRVMRPFSVLVNDARQISEQEFQRPIGKNREDDLESLNYVFSNLIRSFQQYRNDMEKSSSELSDVNRQMLSEIVQRKRTEKRLHYLVEFIKIITDLSSTFIMISSTEVKNWLFHALQAIGEVLGADRGYIVIFTQDRDEVADVFEWQHITTKEVVMKDVDMSAIQRFSWLMRRLGVFENVYVENIEDMPDEASVEGEFFASKSIRSFVAVPLVYGNHLVGFLGFDSIVGQKSWADDVIALVRVGGEIFVNALQRARNDSELLKYRSHLEDLVNQRTQELTAANDMLMAEVADRKQAEEEAKSAKEVAEEANRAKTIFLTNMSHELRTPLNGIIGMTELTLNTQLSAQQRQYLEHVKTSSLSLLSLLNSIIDFSSLEAETLQLNETVFKLSHTIETALDLFTVQAEQAGIKMVSTIAAGVPDDLVGDPERLMLTLTYIVNNALKFTGRGQISINIMSALCDLTNHTPIIFSDPAQLRDLRDRGWSYWQQEDPYTTDRYVMLYFSVLDTGIGIAEDNLRVIFDSFTQVDGSMTRKYGGLGLGLAIAKRFVNMMGGDIWVESTLGKGSNFQFTGWFKLNSRVQPHSINITPYVSYIPQIDIKETPSTEDNIQQTAPDDWQSFVGSYAKELERLKYAIDKKDVISVERHAHILKDMFAQVGVTRLKSEAFRIELASRKKDMNKVEFAFNWLKEEYVKVLGSNSYNDYLQTAIEDKT
ncbi:MAG: hypothetical protein HQL06_15685 [Nitrospirae bacterium]|nr:hypothetical protein [Nitrospirota bacterium]